MRSYFIEPSGNGIFEVEIGEESIFGLQVTFVESKHITYYGHKEEFLKWCVPDIHTAKTKRKELIEAYVELYTKKLDNYNKLLKSI